MKIKNAKWVSYWAATGLVALAFLSGGVADLAGTPRMVATMAHLGYPAYFTALLGTWKVLGAAAVVVPGFPRLKEWAYAGMFFDLIGAAVSHGVSGDGAGTVATPLVLALLVVASWALRPDGRALRAGAPVVRTISPVASGARPAMAVR
jgi:uncharacterized membrane protein YphA (DoxX/SURF4 family)